jgi:hypothetical protein
VDDDAIASGDRLIRLADGPTVLRLPGSGDETDLDESQSAVLTAGTERSTW